MQILSHLIQSRWSACLYILCLFASSAIAQTESDSSYDATVTSRHTVTIHGKSLSYKTCVGYLSLRDEQNQVHGRMFYRGYTTDGQPSDPRRPIIFLWNGGPGSSAALLELGALGPRRIPDKASGSPGTGLVDNDDTWLQFADLVFVDPISTGYSYATSAEYQKEFLSDSGDADAMAEFIRLYLAHYRIQGMPIYLMGESYGTYRAAGVTDILIRRGIPVTGVVLLSALLSLDVNPDLAHAFLLPNYAAAAFAQKQLHGTLATNLAQTAEEVRHWAEGPYLEALVEGDRLSKVEKMDVAMRLASYTGVPTEEWMKNDLRLSPDKYAVEVLKPGGTRYVGHYDTRIIGALTTPDVNYAVDKDPSLDNGVDDRIVLYLRGDLGWKSDMPYSGPFGGRWPSPTTFRGDWTAMRWSRDEKSPDRAALLGAALHAEPGLRILIASGYFDLATPFPAIEYSIDHLFLAPSERARIQYVCYPGGHAAYMDPVVRKQLFSDVAAFVAAR